MNNQLELSADDGRAIANAAIENYNIEVSAFGGRTYCGRKYGARDLNPRVALAG